MDFRIGVDQVDLSSFSLTESQLVTAVIKNKGSFALQLGVYLLIFRGIKNTDFDLEVGGIIEDNFIL